MIMQTFSFFEFNNENKEWVLKKRLAYLLLIISIGIYLISMAFILLQHSEWLLIIMIIMWAIASYAAYCLLADTFYYGGAGWWFYLAAVLLMNIGFLDTSGGTMTIDLPTAITQLKKNNIEYINFTEINKLNVHGKAIKMLIPNVRFTDKTEDFTYRCAVPNENSQLNRYSTIKLSDERLKVNTYHFNAQAGTIYKEVESIIACVTSK